MAADAKSLGRRMLWMLFLDRMNVADLPEVSPKSRSMGSLMEA